jgi:beta-barrel assembly-enhancing protease
MEPSPPRYPAVCFGSQQAGSRPGELVISSRGLEIWCQGQMTEVWPMRTLKLASAGDEQAYLLISTSSPNLIGSVATQEARFRAELVPFMVGEAKEFLLAFDTRKRSVHRRLWINLVICGLVCLGVLVAGYFGLTRGIAAWTAKSMPISTESKWGGYLAQVFLAKEKVLIQGAAVTAGDQILNRLTNALGVATGYTFTLYVVDQPTVNAMALPGGHIVVFTGLLKAADTAEEVAGVIAHELQHVIKRHVVKRMVTTLGTRVLLLSFFGQTDLSSIAVGAGQLLSLSYNRDQEREADREGLLLLDRAKIPTDGLATFFEKLEKQEKLRMPQILSTHPANPARIQAIKETMAGAAHPPPQPLAINWAEVRRSL